MLNAPVSSKVVGFGQATAVLVVGLGLAFLAATSAPLFTMAAALSPLFFLLFLRRPEWGLLIVLFARASSDAVLLVLAAGDPVGLRGLRGLVMNPNTALILILIGAGILTILARRLPMISLPGGILLWLLVITGLFGMIRAERLLHSLDEWIPMLAAPVTYALARGLFGHPARRSLVPKALAASFVLPAVAGYLQLLVGVGTISHGFGVARIYGTFVHPNPFGLYLVILTAVFLPVSFLHSRLAVIARLILVASGPLLMATYARFAWAGAVIVITCIGLVRHRVLLVVLPLLALVTFIPSVRLRLENPVAGSFASRVVLWRGIYDQWMDEATRGGTATSSITSILAGLGPGASTLLTEQFRGGNIPPHNDFVRILVDYGVVGLVLYAALALTMIRSAYRAYRASRDDLSRAIALGFLALAVAYPVMSLTDNLVTATHNQLYFWALAGLAASLGEGAEDGISKGAQHADR